MDETEKPTTDTPADLDEVEDLEDLRRSPFAGLREQLEEPEPERPFSRRRVLQGLAVSAVGRAVGGLGQRFDPAWGRWVNPPRGAVLAGFRLWQLGSLF